MNKNQYSTDFLQWYEKHINDLTIDNAVTMKKQMSDAFEAGRIIGKPFSVDDMVSDAIGLNLGNERGR